jgi:hypothetical protein
MPANLPLTQHPDLSQGLNMQDATSTFPWPQPFLTVKILDCPIPPHIGKDKDIREACIQHLSEQLILNKRITFQKNYHFYNYISYNIFTFSMMWPMT